MRELWSLALIGSIAGCAASGEWSDSPAPPPPTSSDGSTTARDASRAPPATRDAGADRDASSPVDPPDPSDGAASTATDGGSIATPDAGTPTLDAGGGPGPTADCAAPIDVSSGGMFLVDTCLEADRVGGDCAAPGARDALVVADAPFSGSSYQLRVPDGFIIQQVDDSCTAMAWSCGPDAWGVSGAIPWRQWRFAIARADGGCGPAMVEVDRTM